MAFYISKSLLKFVNFSSLPKNVFSRCYAAQRKRFYKNVYVTESDGKFEVSLDKRKLKTPLGNLLQLPNEALAIAVATEWDLQPPVLELQNMHMTSLCNTALDNPCNRNKETLAESILQFLAADTLCYRSNEPPELASLQANEWDPILAWFEERYKVKLCICQDVSAIPASDETVEQMKKQLLSFNDWCLLGINYAAENLKSLILTFALINNKIDVQKAVALSRLETLFQVQRWGNIEWSHDVDKAQTCARVAAAAVFTYLNEGSSNYVDKNNFKMVKSTERVQSLN